MSKDRSRGLLLVESPHLFTCQFHIRSPLREAACANRSSRDRADCAPLARSSPGVPQSPGWSCLPDISRQPAGDYLATGQVPSGLCLPIAGAQPPVQAIDSDRWEARAVRLGLLRRLRPSAIVLHVWL